MRWIDRALALILVTTSASAQLAGSVNTNPTPPPEAAWPIFVDVAGSSGAQGTNFADPGVGRGLAWADVVGPDPADPTNPNAVGPPDGILDVIQANSNSPALPLGAGPSTWITPPIGSSPSPSAVFRGEPNGRFIKRQRQEFRFLHRRDQ